MTNPTTFDRYAHEYDAMVQAAIGASGESVAFFAALKAELARDAAARPPQHVLDFGCGIGNTTRALSDALPSARVLGVDPSDESVRTARARAGSGSRVEFVTVPDNRLPFESGTFDLAVAACVFHHIDEREQLAWAREVARVLEPGGRFVLFEHNPWNPLTRRVVRHVPFDRGVTLLRQRRVRRLLSAAGLRIGRARYYFFFPRFLAALRPLERWLGWLPIGAQYYVVGER